MGLDLTRPVTEEAYHRLCDNLHPLTGEPLTVRQRKVDRRVLFDFVVSAPKSVSIMAVTVGDARILTAHDEACLVAMQQMEKVAATRVRMGGARSDRITGEVVDAVFRHSESRALDPQLDSRTSTKTEVSTFNLCSRAGIWPRRNPARLLGLLILLKAFE